MNKKLMAVAVAGALVAPVAAFAQASNVQLYGLFQVDYQSLKQDGATAVTTVAPAGVTNLGLAAAAQAQSGNNLQQRNRLTSNSSRLGVRGTEDLGNGMNAFFQMESQFQADQPVAVAAGVPAAGMLATRDTFVGLSGKSWGAVQVGFFDTAYASLSYPLDQWIGWGAGLGTSIINNPGLTSSSANISPANVATFSTALSFQRREGNQFQYATTNMNGFEGKIYYAANENRGTSLGAVNSSSRVLNPSLWGGRLTYTNGPLYMGYAIQRHNDYSIYALAVPTSGNLVNTGAAAGPNSSTDTGQKFVAQYKFGATQVGMIMDQLKYSWDGAGATAATMTGYKRTAWALTANHQIGAWNLRATYAKAQDGSCSAQGFTCSTQDMGANSWMLGGQYDMSKRTQLTAYYWRLNNKQYASYAPQGTVGIGSSPSILSLGLRHAF